IRGRVEFLNRVVAITESERPIAQALKTAFEGEGARVEIIPSEQSAEEFARTHSQVDTLILLFPAFPVGSTLALDDALWEPLVNRSLLRAMQLMKAIGAEMVARQRGVILTIGGLAGSNGWPGWAVASAVQGAMLGLTRSLAVEWAQSNVRVLYLATTPAEGEAASANGAGPTSAELMARTPLQRVARVDEIANVARYLASDRASFTTGTQVRADGGWSSWGLLK